jgi:hypothetical protein
MMRRIYFIFYLALLFLVSACAAGRENTAPAPNRAFLERGYDEVWSSLNAMLSGDLEYPIEKAEKGTIETKWISIINSEGTVRWKLVANVKKKKDGTEVEVTKKVQVLEKTSASSKKKRSDKEPEPGMNLGGWRTGQSDMVDEGQILSSLKKKMGL